MAHWIIRDEGSCGNYYTCSNCGKVYNDLGDPCNIWDRCPACGSVIKSYKNVYEVDLRDTPLNHSEATAGEQKPMRDVVILSIEKYDEMRDKIRSLTNELAIKEIEYKDNIKHMTDLFARIGISADVWNKIDEESLEVLEDRNPYNFTTKYMIKFDARRH